MFIVLLDFFVVVIMFYLLDKWFDISGFADLLVFGFDFEYFVVDLVVGYLV